MKESDNVKDVINLIDSARFIKKTSLLHSIRIRHNLQSVKAYRRKRLTEKKIVSTLLR